MRFTVICEKLCKIHKHGGFLQTMQRQSHMLSLSLLTPSNYGTIFQQLLLIVMNNFEHFKSSVFQLINLVK